MKNLIDRMAFVSHRPRFFGKHAMVAVTSCGGGIAEAANYLEDIIRSWGFTFVNKVGVMRHPAVKTSEKTEDKIRTSADRFYSAIKSKKVGKPRLRDLIQFRMMRFNAMESSSHFSADYEFYKDKKDYYTDDRINVFKSNLARLLEKVIVKMMGSSA
jgi:hypothetical protein